MPLEAGSVFVRIAGLFDNSEFSKADRAVAEMRAEAKKPIVYKTEVDNSGMASGAAAGAAGAAIPGSGGTSGARGLLPVGVGSGSGAGAVRGTTAPVDHTGFTGRGTLGALGKLAWTKGGPMGMGGMTLGSMVGLGPEHLIGAGVSFAGSLAPAIAGGGLVAGGALATSAIGAGSDKIVMKSTLTQTKQLYTLTDALAKAQLQYGKNSKQAALAQQALNVQMKEYGNTAGAKAELKLASQSEATKKQFQTMSSGARVQAVGLLSQFLGVWKSYMPDILKAAQRNLGILNKAIEPFFDWLKGPQGKGLFLQLEDDFARKLPTTIHAVSQAFELFLRMFTLAANQGGKFSQTMDKFFSKENARSTQSLAGEVNKLLGSFHLWLGLLKDIGLAFMGIIHSGSGEGTKLVIMLDNVTKKFIAWENSAKGATALKSFFSNRGSEMGQLLKVLGSVVVMFGQFYLSVQPLVPLITLFFTGVNKVLTAVKGLSEHSSLFRDMFVIPMGAFLLSWKLFSLKDTIGAVGKLGKAILVLTGIRKADIIAQDAQAGGTGKKAGGLLRKLVGGAAGTVPVVGGKLKKGILGKAETVAADIVGHGGATGKGPVGTVINPMMVRVEGGGGLPTGSPGGKGAKKVLSTAEKDALSAAEGGVLPTVEKAAVPAAEAVMPSLALTGAEAAGGTGVAAALGSLGVGGALATGIAAALPPVAIAAAIGGAIYLGIKLFASKPAATFAGTQSRHTRNVLTQPGHKETQSTQQLQNQIDSHLAMANKLESSHIVRTPGPRGSFTTSQVGPTSAQRASANSQYAYVGHLQEGRLQAGWDQYGTHDLGTMVSGFTSMFKGAKTKTQAAGAEQMIAYTAGLEKNKELPKGSVKNLLIALEAEYPKLIPILGKNAKAANIALVDGMDLKGFNASWTATWGAIKTGPNSMPDIARYMGAAGHTMQDKWGAALRTLPADTRSSVASVRTIARINLLGMIGDAQKFLPLLPQEYKNSSSAVKGQILHNMALAITGINTLVSEGVIKAREGVRRINNILVGELAAMDFQINKHVKGALSAEQRRALHSGTAATYGPQGNVGVGSRAPGAARGGQLSRLAGGGMVPGREFGYGDRMTLVDPHGRPRARMAGDESVYTRHQRPEVDRGLQAIGYARGSKDLWQRIDRPHGYSGGGDMDYARGGQMSTATRGSRGSMSVTSHHSKPLTSAQAQKLGLTGIAKVDAEVGRLDAQYTGQDNLFLLGAGAGSLSVPELNTLMGIRDHQFRLLFREWKTLPKALANINSALHGHYQHGATGDGPSRPGEGPAWLGTPAHGKHVGGVDHAVKTMTDGVTALENEIIAIQNGQAVTARNVALAGQGASQAALNAANGNAAALAGTTGKLTANHQATAGLTRQIATLTGSLPSAGPQSGNVQHKIAQLKAQRATNVKAAAPLTATLKSTAAQNRANAAALRQQRYDVAWAAAAQRYAIAAKLRGLRTTLTALKKALAAELRISKQDHAAADNLHTRLYGDASGTGSITQELGDYGYDILDLMQQGAKIHPGRMKQIEQVYKALGEVIPKSITSGKGVQNTAAVAAAASLSGFESALSASLLGFGSNFVSAGANPFGTTAQKLAGVTNYGAASGPVPTQAGRARGGELPPPPPPTPYGGKGDTNINITQHFARGPSDAHSYSNGLKWELGAAL